LARTNNVKPKPVDKNADNIITFDDLSDEQHQAYEVLRKSAEKSLRRGRRNSRKSMANPEQGHEDIAEQCLVDREHQSEESRDPEQQEYKALDNHQKGEQDIVLVM
jgi:hypothetical protein